MKKRSMTVPGQMRRLIYWLMKPWTWPLVMDWMNQTNHEYSLSCYMLTLMTEDRLRERIGGLTGDMLVRLDKCLKAALGLA